MELTELQKSIGLDMERNGFGGFHGSEAQEAIVALAPVVIALSAQIEMLRKTPSKASSRGLSAIDSRRVLKLMLVVSEIGEALQPLLDGTASEQCDKGLPLTRYEEELADTAIRVIHLAELDGICLEKIIQVKEDYNRTRTYRHGRLV